MPELAWDELEVLPEGLIFFDEQFYSEECVLLEGGSGLPGVPRLVLDGWWQDQGCVAMSGQVALLRPRIGGALKLQVVAYYLSGQESCDAGNSGASDGGHYEIRWQWLSLPG